MAIVTNDRTMDQTALSTISLLEARLLRIEHLLFGPSPVPDRVPVDSAYQSLESLERRLASLVSQVRVYAELLKIYRLHPSLFQTTEPAEVPTQLSLEATRATVLAFAPSFASTASALTAVTSDTPVPDPELSANMAALLPRMKGLEATQLAQDVEIAELRSRSEQVLRGWYEKRIIGYGQFVADAESRIEQSERAVRRAEKLNEPESI